MMTLPGKVIAKVIYTYPSGLTQEHTLVKGQYKHYHLRQEGSRPIKAECFGEISDDFLYKSLRFSLHPIRREIVVNGKVLESIDPDRE